MICLGLACSLILLDSDIDVFAVGCVNVNNKANSIGAWVPLYAVRKRIDEIINYTPRRLDDVATAQNLLGHSLFYNTNFTTQEYFLKI